MFLGCSNEAAVCMRTSGPLMDWGPEYYIGCPMTGGTGGGTGCTAGIEETGGIN